MTGFIVFIVFHIEINKKIKEKKKKKLKKNINIGLTIPGNWSFEIRQISCENIT